VRIDRHLSEYFLFQTLWALFKSRFTHRQRRPYGAFETQAILDAWQHLPANVVRPERNKRQHLSGVLARNEVTREYPYNRDLFKRMEQGWYQFNPALSVRRRQGEEETWVPIYQALNLPFISEFAKDFVWNRIDEYLALSGLPDRTVSIAAERKQAAEYEQKQREAEQHAALERWRAEQEAPKWGTPEAKQREIERIRAEIKARQKS
jgi:hypothetical protein